MPPKVKRPSTPGPGFEQDTRGWKLKDSEVTMRSSELARLRDKLLAESLRADKAERLLSALTNEPVPQPKKKIIVRKKK